MRAGRKIAGYRRNRDEQRTHARTGICILRAIPKPVSRGFTNVSKKSVGHRS